MGIMGTHNTHHPSCAQACGSGLVLVHSRSPFEPSNAERLYPPPPPPRRKAAEPRMSDSIFIVASVLLTFLIWFL